MVQDLESAAQFDGHCLHGARPRTAGQSEFALVRKRYEFQALLYRGHQSVNIDESIVVVYRSYAGWDNGSLPVIEKGN